MSQKELQRIKVIENAVEGRMTVAEAGELLRLSERQVKRLKRAYRVGDLEWVHHGNSGRTPANAIRDELRAIVVDLATGKYAGFNDTHLHEKLVQKEGMSLSRQSVRRILRQAGILSPQKRRAPKYRSRRERRSQEGAMLLVDASRHDWLEGRGPHLTLLGAVDDATSRVTVGQFQLEAEDSAGYMRLFRQQVTTHGIPLSIYRDQHGTMQRNDKHWSVEEQLAGRQFPTQVGRMLEELGIQAIAAKTAQAKGRIERAWRTFQDRLVSELRLAGAATLEQANVVLETFVSEYNERFATKAAIAGKAYRKLDRRLDLNYIFSLRYSCKVNNAHVIRAIPGVEIQLPALANGRGYAGRSVEACHQPNGDFHIYLDRALLHVEPAAADAGPVRAHAFRKHSGPRKKKPLAVRTFNAGVFQRGRKL